MSEFAGCVILEVGWGFFAILALVVVAAPIFFIWFLVFRQKATGRIGESIYIAYQKIKGKVTGSRSVSLVAAVVTLVLIVLIGAAVWQGYERFRNSYSVALDISSGISLDQARQKFQNDTQVTITIDDAAKEFVIKGNYAASCVPDLFSSICRQYSSQISCNTSWFSRTQIISLRKLK